MKNIYLLPLLLIIQFEVFAQSITINPNGQDLLDVKGNTATPKGIVVPRYTSVQRNSISSPSDGTMVYDTDTKNFWFYSTSTPGWIKIASGNVGLDLPYSASVYGTGQQALFQIDNTNSNEPWGILSTTPFLSNSGIAIYGLDLGLSGVGVYGRSDYNTGIKGSSTYGGFGGDFIGRVRVSHENSSYDVPELELLRGTGGVGNPAFREARIAMGKYTNGGYNNRWMLSAKVNGIQSQPTDRFRIQYSTNNAINTSYENYSNADILTIQPNGNIGVGVDPSEKLDINGSLKFSGKLNANGSFGNNGEVLTSTGNSTPPQWKALGNSQYNNLIISNLTSSGTTVNSLNGTFTLTKPSKIIVNVYASYEVYISCSSSFCPNQSFKLSTCIGNGFGCVTGREVTVSGNYNEYSNFGTNLLVTGNAQKVFSLNAGSYNYETTFSQTASGNLLGGGGANPTQVTIQIIEN
jgi:hypothetical protein